MEKKSEPYFLTTHCYIGNIERSADGKEFTFIAAKEAGSEKYSFEDIAQLKGTHYYRFKIIEKDGKFTYRPIKLVNNSRSLIATLYPNPVKNIIQVKFNSVKQIEKQIQVLSAEGRVILSNIWTIPQGESVQSLHVAQLQKGSYLLKVTGPNNEQDLFKFQKL